MQHAFLVHRLPGMPNINNRRRRECNTDYIINSGTSTYSTNNHVQIIKS
ncbi:Uncharacterised protein [Klebsiella oxytoca]|nr:Uncharacterised protein [Klebsiella oxytoca]